MICQCVFDKGNTKTKTSTKINYETFALKEHKKSIKKENRYNIYQ